MKTFVFNAKNTSVSVVISAESFDCALEELHQLTNGVHYNENDFRLDNEEDEEDGHEELPHGNEHWNDEKAKRPTPEDCMHISPELKAQLDEVSKNRYFTPDENTKKI